MQDCYAVLGVSSSASAAEVKRAFRRKVKELHPDIPENSAKAADSASHLRRLIDAYETLSEPSLRSEFDALYAQFSRARGPSPEASFDYRRWLMRRTDSESRAKLIFFDLLHDLEEEAVLQFLTCRSESVFVLSRYFGREDFMDCGFILAEELFFRANYYESFLLLAEVIALEQQKPYFKHFFPEVLLMAREIIRDRLSGTVNDELTLDCLETALELSLGKKTDALVLALMAGCYERIGDRLTARKALQQALALDQKVSGVRLLRKKLEV